MYSEFLEWIGKDFILATLGDVESRKESMQTSNRTKNLYIHAVRKLYFYLRIVGEPVIDYKNILLCREWSRKETDFITKEEVLEILDNLEELDNRYQRTRNILIVRLLRETWLRVSELANLKREDVDYYANSIRILGKWNKERVVFLSYETKRDLMMRKSASAKFSKVYIICWLSTINYWDKLSRNSIETIIRNLNHTWKKITPHSFRHWMATHILRAGGNLVDISKLLGHSNLTTTSTYLHSERKRTKEIQSLCW